MNTKVTILGSGAAEAIPAFFCDCRVCRNAREKGGKEIRFRTSYNFGGVLQIDYGPDILQAFVKHPELNEMKHLLVTHAHGDHLSPQEFWFRGRGFCTKPFGDGRPLGVHGSAASIARAVGYEANPTPQGPEPDSEHAEYMRLAPHVVKAGDVFTLDDIGAEVRAFQANHAPNINALVYIVTMGGRTVLFFNDSGYPTEKTREMLKALNGGLHIDLAIYDNTGAFQGWRDGHMGAQAVLDTIAFFRECGLSDDRTTNVVNHFSHNGGATHEELCEFWSKHGVLVGYDDMIV